jgi:hypothetical protein
MWRKPLAWAGALISVGDGHGVQGNGEVGLSAMETSLRGEIQVILHKGMRITWPRAETPTHYMTMGLHADLNEAAKITERSRNQCGRAGDGECVALHGSKPQAEQLCRGRLREVEGR